jgi:hypothetical protein
MARGKTQKKRSKSHVKPSVLTIPELRKSLDYISNYAEKLVKSGTRGIKDLARDFASEWKKTFGKTLPVETAESYLKHLKSMMKGSKKGRMTRRLRGGAQSTELTGAPLDYMTRPGTYIPYGNFLKYVDSGFTNPEPAINWDCGKQTGVLPYASTGSNKMNGGGFFSAFATRPFVAENPQSVGHDAQTVWKGQQLGPGPNSYDVGYKYQLGPSGPMPSIITEVYNRNLAQDVTMSQRR